MSGMEEFKNQFTREGVEQIEEAVRERKSVGDMTKLKLLVDRLWEILPGIS